MAAEASSATAPRAPGAGLPLAVSMGDPAGVGLDITLAAWVRRRELNTPPFAIFADPSVVGARARSLGLSVSIQEFSVLAGVAGAFAEHLPVRVLDCAASVVAGRPDPANAGATIAAVELAVAAVERGEASAVVTAPIAKSVLAAAGFAHPGHTEFLAELARRRHAEFRTSPVMMLACGELKVVPLTIHIPLAAVPGRISEILILETVRTMHAALGRDYGLHDPRIAVAGLNPHAGESGTIGTEERDVIAPALDALRSEGIRVSGPHSADALFHAEARRGYDAVLAMYHDQALIPIKTLAFDSGVNVTLGLPFVRTSPDHGTAFDIAGTGRASPASFIAALQMAAAIAARRSAKS